MSNMWKRLLGISHELPKIRYTEREIELYERQVIARFRLDNRGKKNNGEPASFEVTLEEIPIDFEGEQVRLELIEGTLNQLEW
jgi:hypothetical protein